jgi:single-strand DNA-binding protein
MRRIIMANKVILVGNLGSDPVMNTTPSGTPVANINIATNEKWTDKQGEKQEATEWHRLVFWARHAEILAEFCSKGSKLFVEGSLQTRSWEDDQGNKRYSTEVRVRNFEMLDPKGARDSGNGMNDEESVLSELEEPLNF